VWSDEGATELARAYIVLKSRVLGSEERAKAAETLSAFVADRVAHYKQLKGGIVFVDELPKNPTGKVLRRALREQAKKESKKDSVAVARL
jgi:acyl-coenzyme A synthetase/AMP-(fatty) acid ligase